MRWVTSCGTELPVIVQIVCGCATSVTSASSVPGVPCMTSSASCAVGWPVQFADMLAHVGTCEPLLDGVGVGDGLGEGEGVGDSEAVGEVRTLVFVVVPQAGAPQAAASITPASASNPSLRRTWLRNEAGWLGVTRRPRDTGAKGYGSARVGASTSFG